MKILIIHDKYLLESGGCEKICTFLANSFSSVGNQVKILTYEQTTRRPAYPPVPSVEVVNLFNDYELVLKKQIEIRKYKGANPIKWLFSKIKRKIDKNSNKNLLKRLGGRDGIYMYNLNCKAQLWNDYILVDKPDVIITLNLSTALEVLHHKKHDVPVINSVNGRPDFDYTNILWTKSDLEISLLRDCYQYLSGYQLLLSSYVPYLPNPRKGICKVIGNPISQINKVDLVNHSTVKERYIISHVGSLALDHKQQDIAIKVFASISNKYPNWDMHFYGVGKDLYLLEDLLQRLNLTKRVFLKGFTSKPINELRNSDIFIFPSKFEGFPLALTEAMSVGLPCLGFSSCAGVNELIKHGETGFLAANDDELKIHLTQLISSPELRSKMGTLGHIATAAYTPENIAEKWHLLVEEVIQNNLTGKQTNGL